MAKSTRAGRWLFRLACALAAILAMVVCFAPFLDGNDPAPVGWRRIVALFAHDATLSGTGLAGAAGLLVTAYVFFRPVVPSSRPQRPSGAAGA